MRNYILAALALAWPVFAADYSIDSVHSSAQFSVRHMMVSNVKGQFSKISGSVSYDPKNVAASAIDVTIDAASIDTREPKRDAHLKSPDFFDVAKFPALTFKSKKVERAGEKIKVLGDLTIHGVTREVILDVEGPAPEVSGMGGIRTGASATTRISRKDFGMIWNRALEAGGLTVGDEVAINIDVELVRKSQS